MRARSGRPTDDKWWQRGVVYQVYPRSFRDSNSDGVGDLGGITASLDYLRWLGVDAVWLSPIFRSPMADFGYDVADYEDVDPLFGTLTNLDELIGALHRRDMRLLLDLVPNHTSSEHPWFVDSRSSRAAAHRDWYIWRDARPDGSPPNGWICAFGGSVWEWDEGTGQFYFHSFLKEQPDLNWANPAVRAAMHDVMRFWFRRGVDGFRIDVVNLLAKRFELETLPSDVMIDLAAISNPDESAGVFQGQRWAATSTIYPIISDLRGVADEFDDPVLVGEIWLPIRRLMRFYGRHLDGLHMPFNFQLITTRWRAPAVHRVVASYEGALPAGAWPNWVLGNHDKSRIASRVGAAQARVAAVLLLTLRGTPTLYYGDELGMADVGVPVDAQRDPQGLRGGKSRDPERTPMRWDGSPLAGFSAAQPWLPIGPDVASVNVAAERDDPDSMLSLHRRLLEMRRTEPALNIGEWHDLGHTPASLAYLRSDGSRRFLIVANLTAAPTSVTQHAQGLSGTVVLSTVRREPNERYAGADDLAADEAIVVELD